MEFEEIRRLVDELDKGVSKENAKIGLYRYGGEGDGSWVVGTRNGYLRFAIEFLKAGVASSEPESARKLIDVDMQNLVDADSTIDFTIFEVVEEFTKDAPEESWGDKIFTYAVIGILIAIPILAVLGLITLVRMFVVKRGDTLVSRMPPLPNFNFPNPNYCPIP